MTERRTRTGIFYKNKELGIEERAYSLNCHFFDKAEPGIHRFNGKEEFVMVLGFSLPITKDNSLFYWIQRTNGEICGVHHSTI